MKLFPVTDYGTYDENAANHDDLINGAYAAALSHGAGEIYFPFLGAGKEYRTTGIWIKDDFIGLRMEFNGADIFSHRVDGQGKRVGCVIRYVGAAGGNAIRIEPDAAARDFPLNGVKVRDLQLDANGAGNGFKIGAVRGGSFKRLFIQGATGAQFHTQATAISTAIRSGAYGNYAEQIWAKAAGTAYSFLFAGDWNLDNAGGRHTAFLTLVAPHATHENSAAYAFYACDDVVLVNAAASRPSGTGPYAYFHGSNSGNRCGEGNYVFGGNGQGDIRAVGGARPSRSNTLFITSVDSQPQIVKDGNATIYVYDTGGQVGNNAYFKHPQLIAA